MPLPNASEIVAALRGKGTGYKAIKTILAEQYNTHMSSKDIRELCHKHKAKVSEAVSITESVNKVIDHALPDNYFNFQIVEVHDARTYKKGPHEAVVKEVRSSGMMGRNESRLAIIQKAGAGRMIRRPIPVDALFRRVIQMANTCTLVNYLFALWMHYELEKYDGPLPMVDAKGDFYSVVGVGFRVVAVDPDEMGMRVVLHNPRANITLEMHDINEEVDNLALHIVSVLYLEDGSKVFLDPTVEQFAWKDGPSRDEVQAELDPRYQNVKLPDSFTVPPRHFKGNPEHLYEIIEKQITNMVPASMAEMHRKHMYRLVQQ